MTLSQKTLAIATTQLGVQEIPKGSNAGPAVESYLKSVGLSKGYSWCMAFVYWCVNNAAKELGAKNPLLKTGGVLAQWNFIGVQKSTLPAPGYIFIMDLGKGLGHTGLIEKIVGDTLYTIEGNTNDEGSREGFEVCRRTRKTSQMKGYLKIS